MSPLTNILSRGDSISGTSPSGGMAGLNNDPNNPMLPGAGLHRGSIQGIPGLNAPGAQAIMQTSRSPVKESSYLARQASSESASAAEGEGKENMQAIMEGSISPPAKKEGIPIRRG